MARLSPVCYHLLPSSAPPTHFHLSHHLFIPLVYPFQWRTQFTLKDTIQWYPPIQPIISNSFKRPVLIILMEPHELGAISTQSEIGCTIECTIECLTCEMWNIHFCSIVSRFSKNFSKSLNKPGVPLGVNLLFFTDKPDSFS